MAKGLSFRETMPASGPPKFPRRITRHKAFRETHIRARHGSTAPTAFREKMRWPFDGLSMHESFSSPFIRYPIGTSLLMAGILFVGLVAYPLLPVAPLPQVDFPTIQVSANLPGASPETMATSVAQPLERQFAQIPRVAQMTSTSVLGSAA